MCELAKAIWRTDKTRAQKLLKLAADAGDVEALNFYGERVHTADDPCRYKYWGKV